MFWSKPKSLPQAIEEDNVEVFRKAALTSVRISYLPTGYVILTIPSSLGKATTGL